jgi:hypothetical protein
MAPKNSIGNEPVSTTIPTWLVKKIDRLALEQHIDRAAWLRRAVHKQFLLEQDRPEIWALFSGESE